MVSQFSSKGKAKLISSVCTQQVSILNLWMDLPLEKALDAPRLHHQFIPNEVIYNPKGKFRISEAVQKGLEKKGHVVKEKSGMSVVQAVAYKPGEEVVYGAADPRKGGMPWGI